MLLMLWIIIVIYGLAVILDQVMTDRQVKALKSRTEGLHRKIEVLDGVEAIKTAHNMFCELFDEIYGKKYWSWKRIWRSYGSSLIAFGGVTVLLGWETTIFGNGELVGEGSAKKIIGVAIGIFILNTTADYISLQETRWVLGRSNDPGLWKLGGMAVFDVIATASIWVVIMAIVHVVWTEFTKDPFRPESLISQSEGLPFVLSTFFTSAAWWLYLLTVAVVRMAMRQSRLFGFLLDAIAESGSPARMTATILSILLVAVYGISIGVIWVVEAAI